jgi:fermentation-respiration switch protein FrsA (DUF1100 family)
LNLITERQVIRGIPVLEFTDSDTPCPRALILILHGFTGKKEDHVIQGQALARAGYAAVSIDAHLHGELGTQPFDPTLVGTRIAEIVGKTMTNIDLLIEHYTASERAGSTCVGLLGISLGGSIFYHYLPTRNPAVRSAVTLISGVHPVWSKVLRNVQTLYPAWGITDTAVDAARAVEALPFLEGLCDFPLRAQLGEADPLVPIEDMRALYANVQAGYTDKSLFSLVTYPGVGHETPAGMYKSALEWFNRYL